METGNKQVTILHDIIDEGFDSSHVLSYHMSLQLSTDGLVFCILDQKNNKYLLLKSYRFNKISASAQLAETFESIILQDDLLVKKYKSVSLILINNQFTIVPSPLFDIAMQKLYLKFNAGFDDNAIISNDLLKCIDARNVYAIPHEIDKVIRKNFGSCNIIHNTSSFIESLINRNKNSSNNQLFINVGLSSFDMVLINGNKLECCNSFTYQSSEDFVYYLLFSCEQLKLNPENINLVLAGQVEKTSPHFTMLHRYIRNISFISRNEAYSYSYKFDEIPGNFYYNLFNVVML